MQLKNSVAKPFPRTKCGLGTKAMRPQGEPIVMPGTEAMANEEQTAAAWKQFEAERRPFEDEMRVALARALQEQRQAAVEALRRQRGG